ncbi:MAG: tryptophan--tRNA ligase [Alphaproteobacteria bacterium]|nr:tryptophan--tRNA ligase [Alphaproteobacteria bacterium]
MAKQTPKKHKVMLTGVRPSGSITLGNYLGAIKNFADKQGLFKSYIFIADLHAITEPRQPAELKAAVNQCMAMYLACGIDPGKTVIFRQSDIAEHGIMGFIMAFQTRLGELSRMTQFKLKSAAGGKSGVGTGLFIYPALMAADILLYDTDIVPVGADQQQHVELTRDMCQRFNKRYGAVLNEPDAFVAPVGNRILNLRNPLEKMNKSDCSDNMGTIFLSDGADIARKKVMTAVSDGLGLVKFDQENQPGISNLISILSCITGQSIADIESRFEAQGYAAFKSAVADSVCCLLRDIQERYRKFNDPKVLEDILSDGRARAEKIAEKTCQRAKTALGLA